MYCNYRTTLNFICQLGKNILLTLTNYVYYILIKKVNVWKSFYIQVYKKQVFKEDSYLELYRKSKKVFNSRQLQALQKLYQWRDKLARQEDESTG